MIIKGTLNFLFRKAGLMFWADKAKFWVQYLVNFRNNHTFKAANKDLALPPAYMMFESFNMNYQKYYEGGFKTAKWILDTIEPYLDYKNAAILDWGCGPARITRHLPELCGSESNIYGTDYNPATIRWCSESIKQVSFSVNKTAPPLHYKTNTFDMVIGISIFTHLSEENHYSWIAELHRVIKPGGIAFITTHGKIFRSLLTEKELETYDREKIVIRGAVTEGHRVYTAFQPPTWMKEVFCTSFEILRHHEGKQADWGKEQDFWILKKS